MPHGLTTPSNHPERTIATAAAAIERRLPFFRSMTEDERLAVAISGAAPDHLLTLHSGMTDRPRFAGLWRCLVKRIDRQPKRSRPLIYVATIANSNSGKGGYHLHALLWEYLHAPLLHKHCRELRLGKPRIDRLPSPADNYTQVLAATAYVVGQHQPVFANDAHERHKAPPRYARRLITPQRRTLADHHPNLLSALDRARSRSATDMGLVRSVPRFSR